MNDPFEYEKLLIVTRFADAYSEPSQISKMKLFAKIVSGIKLLTDFPKISILDVWLGFEYVSGLPVSDSAVKFSSYLLND